MNGNSKPDEYQQDNIFGSITQLEWYALKELTIHKRTGAIIDTEIPGIPVEDGYFTDDYGQFNMEVMLELKSMGNHKIFYIY